MRIGLPFGYWSTNIGNSFFQLGAEKLLSGYSGVNTFRTSDFAGYCSPARGRPSNSFDSLDLEDFDTLALLGPFITPNSLRILEGPLEKFCRRGGRLIGIGAGMMDYGMSAGAIEQLFQKLQFEFISTRDTATFNMLKRLDIQCAIHDGIDPAFFIKDALSTHVDLEKKYSQSGVPRVALNFDQMAIQPKVSSAPIANSLKFSVGENTLYIANRKLVKENILINHSRRILRSFVATYEEPDEKVDVVNTDHRFNPFLSGRIYSRQNTYASDTPEGYLKIYANCDLVATNRVHACVASLCLGTPALLLSATQRVGLLERVGAVNITNQIVRPNDLAISSEKERYVEELRILLSGLS